MKFLLISDTHRELTNARKVIKKHKADLNLVIHCGDNIEDAKVLEKEFPEIDFVYVPGNCDPLYFEDGEKIIEVNGQKILITHGDRFDINYSYDRFFYYLESKEMDVGICGHTHRVHLEKDENRDITIINPGSLSLPRDSSRPSYSLLYMDNAGLVDVKFFRLNG